MRKLTDNQILNGTQKRSNAGKEQLVFELGDQEVLSRWEKEGSFKGAAITGWCDYVRQCQLEWMEAKQQAKEEQSETRKILDRLPSKSATASSAGPTAPEADPVAYVRQQLGAALQEKEAAYEAEEVARSRSMSAVLAVENWTKIAEGLGITLGEENESETTSNEESN